MGGKSATSAPLARAWTELEPERVEGWRALIDIALRRFEFDEAERMARAIADQAPQFAQLTILRVRDVRGSYVDRLRGVEAAITLASLGGPLELRAEVHIYAAETLLDLVGRAPEAAKSAMLARAERYRGLAYQSLKGSGLTGERLRIGIARTRLLSLSESEQALGARALTEALEKGTDAPATALAVRGALARYHSARGAWEPTGAIVRAVRASSALVWFRAVRRVAESGPVDLALALLDDSPTAARTPVTLLRAQVLLRGTEAQVAAGQKLLTDLVERESSNPSLGIRAYSLLAAGGQGAAGLELLESVAGSGSDVRAQALLANELSADEASRDRALRIIETLPGKVSTLGETLAVLRLLRRGGGPGVERYLSAEILAGGAEGARKRLIRAAACVALRAKSNKAGRARLRTAIVADLAVLEQAKLSKPDLARAWLLALDVRETRLAGSLVGRAISMEGPPHGLAFGSVQLAARLREEAHRASFAEGILAQASGDGPAAFLTLLAATVAQDPIDEDALRKAAATLGDDEASAVPALFLSAQLALDADDRMGAESAAQKLVERLPDSVEARLLLGDLLILRKAWQRLLELHQAPTGTVFPIYRQRVAALWELGRSEEALETARLAVRNIPRSAEAHLLLAGVHLRAERRGEALGVLSVAPLTRSVALLRARLLLARGERLVAELLFAGVLARWPGNMEALRGVASILTTENRSKELVDNLTRLLESPRLKKDDPRRGELLVMRGSARENLEEVSEALRDYDEALRILPKSLMALNNVAWLILEREPDQVAKAEGYVKRALALAPTHPSILDTAARLYLRKGEHDEALKHVDGALKAKEKPGYMLRRAEILRAMGQEDEARAQLKQVLEKFRDSPEARTANDLLR